LARRFVEAVVHAGQRGMLTIADVLEPRERAGGNCALRRSRRASNLREGRAAECDLSQGYHFAKPETLAGKRDLLGILLS
jgi:hypothetical protein